MGMGIKIRVDIYSTFYSLVFQPVFPHLIRDKFNKRILIKYPLQASPLRGIWDPPALVAAMGELDSLPNIQIFFFSEESYFFKKMDLIGDHIRVS